MTTTDETLLAQYAAGHLPSFESLVKRYERAIFTYCRRFINQESIAEELMQEVFIKVIQHTSNPKAQTQNQPASFKTWIYIIARNVCIDALRKRNRRPHTEPFYQEPTAEQPTIDPQLKQRLESAFSKLSPEYREVILLKEIAHFNFAEIAEVLQCPLGTAKSRMRYGLIKLQSLLAETKTDVIPCKRSVQ